MSEEKRPEAQGSDQQTANDSSSSSGGTTRQQPVDARRTGGNTSGGLSNSSGGGGRHGSRRRHRGGGGERENQTPSSRRTETSINMDELRELADLIAAQGFTEFELEKEGFRLRLSRNVYSQPAMPTGGANADSGGFTHFSHQPPAAASHAATATAETNANAGAAAAPVAADNVQILTSPIVGTFYRAPAPD
ncbi:MAG TPA: hypothetical protein VER76_18005, partial [Pyrinomonadaceae bacterium]|nr:hypothetical protein [Pyrinomonadaceae bacterium]